MKDDAVRESGALGALLDRFHGQRVLVVGDVMLDHFVFGRVQRISPEAPVPVVEFDHEQYRLGGAANVAHNLRAYDAAVTLVGIVGRDEAASRVDAALEELGLACDGLVRTSRRPTTRKMRIVTTRNQQVARVDYEADADVSGELEDEVVERAAAGLDGVGVAVVSDYLKGVVTARVMARLVEEAERRSVPVLVDPKIPHIAHYRGAALVTPNHHEAEVATSMRIRTEEDARLAARAFRARTGCRSVLITRGEHGMWLLDGGLLGTQAPAPGTSTGLARAIEAEEDGGIAAEVSLEALAREVADVTGAGDTVIATVGLALAAGAGLRDAATLANHAASVAVAKFGPATVTREELRATFDRDER